MPKTIRYSTNPALVDKLKPAGKRAYSDGWQNVETSTGALIANVKRGFAFAPQYEDGVRRTENFICSQFLAADFDGTRTLDEVRNDPFVNAYASFIYTTVSHTQETPRFRVVFVTTDPINKAQDYADGLLGLAERLGSDLSVNDGARCWFGASNAQVWELPNRLPADLADKLIERGRFRRKAKSASAPISSGNVLASDTMVRLQDGSLAALRDLPLKTPIHCPYHDDRNPSAFTVRSVKSGSFGIHCKACNFTYFEAEPDEYDLYGFDRLVEDRAANPKKKMSFNSVFDEYFPARPTCHVSQERYLPPLRYRPGVTLIKSPKGTGKTKVLEALISDVLAGRNLDHVARKDRPKTVLLIGHRRSLLKEAARKLRLRYYRALGDDLSLNAGTLAVCLDSLHLFTEPYINLSGPKKFRQGPPYDLVILDESEQLLAHSIGDTLGRKQGAIDRAYDALEYQVSRAKAVVALDADLSLLTAHTIKSFRPGDWDYDTQIFYNKPMPPTIKRTLQLFEREVDLRQDLLEALSRGERCFVACNSKKTASVLREIVKERCGPAVKMQVITSDNSGQADEIEFVENIAENFLKIQVLICSPSLGTGIDITFPDPAGQVDGGLCKVDCVYGFFSANVNTHTDMDQQLCRVRNPGAVKVWISPTPFQYSTNFDVIRDDLARARFVPRAVAGYTDDGETRYKSEHPQLMIYSHAVAAQRSSKNRLIPAFCELRERNGWEIEHVPASKNKDLDRPEAERILWTRKVQGLLSAPILNDDEYFDLVVMREAAGKLDEKGEYTYARNTLERQLSTRLTYHIICLDSDGRLRDRVAILKSILSQWATFQADSDAHLEGMRLPLARLPKMPPERLLSLIARVSGLSGSDGFDGGVTVTAAELGAFADVCERNRTLMEELLGTELRKDIRTNPVRQLNTFLKFCGLRLEKLDKRRVGGKPQWRYGLDQKVLGEMTLLAQNYKEPTDLKEAYERVRDTGIEWKPVAVPLDP